MADPKLEETKAPMPSQDELKEGERVIGFMIEIEQVEKALGWEEQSPQGFPDRNKDDKRKDK